MHVSPWPLLLTSRSYAQHAGQQTGHEIQNHMHHQNSLESMSQPELLLLQYLLQCSGLVLAHAWSDPEASWLSFCWNPCSACVLQTVWFASHQSIQASTA